ncbi:hypothetical protein, partial [Petrachloros mirabilis]
MEVTGLPRTILVMGVAGAALVAAVGCTGAKVTTKSSRDISQYQIRTIAMLPFSSMATPQVYDQSDAFVSAPQSVRRSDISIEVPSSVESPPRQTATVPSYAAEKVTQLFWTRLKMREGLTVSSPS